MPHRSVVTTSPVAHPTVLTGRESFEVPSPWHSLDATRPVGHCATVDLFRALCAHPMHRLSGVAHDDDPALDDVARCPNEGRRNDGIGRAFAFVIDDVRITLVEDANDGYRSIAEEATLEWQGHVRNRFVPVDVNVVWSPQVRWGDTHGDRSLDASLIELRCPYTQGLILEAGTSWGDEHYPSMIEGFFPEAMVETVRRAEARVLRETADAAQTTVRIRAVRPRL